MRLVVLSDFDGTIVEIDTAAIVLERFAEGEWKIFDEQLERGEIALEECMRRQFSLVRRVSQKKILNELDRVTTFRPNFEKLVEFCKRAGISLLIVSAGLDFCVKHFLAKKRLANGIGIVAPKAKCTLNGIKFTFPRLRHRESHNFKDDIVRYYKERGQKVVYIGDSLNDYHAVRNADLGFVIKGSELAAECQRHGTLFREVTDFGNVVHGIQTAAFHSLGNQG